MKESAPAAKARKSWTSREPPRRRAGRSAVLPGPGDARSRRATASRSESRYFAGGASGVLGGAGAAGAGGVAGAAGADWLGITGWSNGSLAGRVPPPI
jgi:hypothetical protein